MGTSKSNKAKTRSDPQKLILDLESTSKKICYIRRKNDLYKNVIKANTKRM